MSALESRVIQSLHGMSDDKLQVVFDVIQSLAKLPALNSPQPSNTIRKLGIYRGRKLIADNYDFDACNDEIAEMFGVSE